MGNENENEWENIDCICFNLETISQEEQSTIFFICGFITKKENLSEGNLSEFRTSSECSEFTDLVSRGKLCYPTEDLFNFATECYVYFTKVNSKNCRKRLVKIFKIIADTSYSLGEKIDKICTRLVNTYLKGYTLNKNDEIAVKSFTKSVENKRRKENGDNSRQNNRKISKLAHLVLMMGLGWCFRHFLFTRYVR